MKYSAHILREGIRTQPQPTGKHIIEQFKIPAVTLSTMITNGITSIVAELPKYHGSLLFQLHMQIEPNGPTDQQGSD